jgi:hypothetical protein
MDVDGTRALARQLGRMARIRPSPYPLSPRHRASSSSSSSFSSSLPVSFAARKPVGGDAECPICFDALRSAPACPLVGCPDCGVTLHDRCMTRWLAAQAGARLPSTCVKCRSDAWTLFVPAPPDFFPARW